MRSIVLVVIATICLLTAAQCPTRVRRSWYSHTRAERDLFLAALNTSFNKGLYQTFAQIHLDNFPNTHGTSLFLPWHRHFIWVFENALRALGPQYACMTLPYWSWEQTSLYGTDYLLNPGDYGTRVAGCILDSQFSKWKYNKACITRNYPTVSLCGEACLQASITTNTKYGADDGFRSYFEAIPHATPHNWLGGDMASSTSCRDPLFFLHHVNVDRIWGIWQDCLDHDKVLQTDLGTDQYESSPTDSYPLDYCMPFNNNQYFPGCITPRMVYHIQGNLAYPSYSYAYDDRNMVSLLNTNYRKCKWNWNWTFPNTNSTVPTTPTPTPVIPTPTPTPSPPTTIKCSERNDNCSYCIAAPACGWCATTGRCLEGNSSQPFGATCAAWSWTGCSTASCSDHDDCSSCTGAQGCGWCPSTSTCSHGTRSGPDGSSCSTWAWSASDCPSDCSQNTNCGDCTAASSCGWCASSNTCSRGTRNGPDGSSCSSWAWAAAACNSGCTQYNSCENCTRANSCGWCPTLNTCYKGTKTGPTETGSCSNWRWSSCSAKKRSQLDHDEEENNNDEEDTEDNGDEEEEPLDYPEPSEDIRNSPEYLGDYYFQAIGGTPTTTITAYRRYPGMFCNPYVQNAKMHLDAYFVVRPDDSVSRNVRLKMHMYHVAECYVEGVTSYVTDEWLELMNMQHMKNKTVPPCFKETLPVDINSESTL